MKILLIEDSRDLAANMFDYFEMREHIIDLPVTVFPACISHPLANMMCSC